jgi:hypothetical protein
VAVKGDAVDFIGVFTHKVSTSKSAGLIGVQADRAIRLAGGKDATRLGPGEAAHGRGGVGRAFGARLAEIDGGGVVEAGLKKMHGARRGMRAVVKDTHTDVRRSCSKLGGDGTAWTRRSEEFNGSAATLRASQHLQEATI